VLLPTLRRRGAKPAASAPPRRRVIVIELDTLEPRRLLSSAFAVSVNFQPAGSAVPAGYLADSGLTFASRGNGYQYGWSRNLSFTTRDRNSARSPDQRYDTLLHTQQYGVGSWEIAVPNGAYSVHLVAGDPDYLESVYKFNIENTLALSGTPTTSHHWIESTTTVTVSDGRLTISNAAGSIGNKLSFVEITSAGPAPGPTVATVPGTIQAEDFDGGGAGVSYFDTTSANLGGAYRNTAVDLITASEGAFAVGYMRATEWLNYTFDAPAAGTYTLDLRVACGNAGGTFHVEFDGVNRTGEITMAPTGGWQSWKTLSRSGISLTAGRHIMRVAVDSSVRGGDMGNLNWLKLSTQSVTVLPAVSIAATDSSASESGPNTGTFTVSRTGSTAASLLVRYTIGGSATNGVDYNALGGSVTIPAGKASAAIVVTPRADAVDESNETVTLALASNAAYATSGGSATLTIADAPQSLADWPASFHTVASAPRGRWESSSVALDGKIWLFGGWVSASTVGTQYVDVYDVASNKWTSLPNKAPIPHTHAAPAVDAANHVIYFAGGLFGDYPGTPTNQVWKFDTRTLVWTQMPSLPVNRSSGALVLINNELHYFGGVLDEREVNTDRHDVLKLGDSSWTSAPPMPTGTGRDHLAGVALGGKIYAIGGEYGHDQFHLQQSLVQSYDPIAKTWSQIASLPTPKSHFESGTFVYDGRIFCCGGQIANYGSTDEVDVFDPATGKWTIAGRLPAVLQGPVVQRVGDQIVVTTGNTGNLVALKTTWVGNIG
jgi:N-acetylneuraminic acid mutarotase